MAQLTDLKRVGCLGLYSGVRSNKGASLSEERECFGTVRSLIS